jgi:hypothetical protein
VCVVVLIMPLCVCLLLQDLVQSCLQGGGGDMGGHVQCVFFYCSTSALCLCVFTVCVLLQDLAQLLLQYQVCVFITAVPSGCVCLLEKKKRLPVARGCTLKAKLFSRRSCSL